MPFPEMRLGKTIAKPGWVPVDTPTRSRAPQPSSIKRVCTLPTGTMPLFIRSSTPQDLPAIEGIYAHAVLHGTGTFELTPPDGAELRRRWDDVTGKGLPWLVAVRDDRIIGYAYANTFRPRPAYRSFLEDSIYLAPTAQGQGVGRLLLSELLARCTQWGARQMVAVIGDSANAGSIGVHAGCGFERTGTLHDAGWKFGRWLDVVLMQRSLGPGAHTPLPEPPLPRASEAKE